MKILGCDTSSDYAVFFVADTDRSITSAIQFEHRRDLSRQFYSRLEECLNLAGITFAEVDAFAVGLGPGSFTGVRVAVTTFRTFAQTTKKPLVGVSTLDIFGGSVSDLLDGQRLLVVLPSRKNELYAGWYDNQGNRLGEPFVATISSLQDVLADSSGAENVVIAGRVDLIPEGLAVYRRIEMSVPVVGYFVTLAVKSLLVDVVKPYEMALPLYIAPPAISRYKNAKVIR